ncbi:MAG: hypothetical protein NZM04_05570 [Methylacidiphilales bacterium]|nr:hypothetical protein [Candidatus Methylacidiphilales bacterium]
MRSAHFLFLTNVNSSQARRSVSRRLGAVGWGAAKARSPAHLTQEATDCALDTQIAPDASEAVAI